MLDIDFKDPSDALLISNPLPLDKRVIARRQEPFSTFGRLADQQMWQPLCNNVREAQEAKEELLEKRLAILEDYFIQRVKTHLSKLRKVALHSIKSVQYFCRNALDFELEYTVVYEGIGFRATAILPVVQQIVIFATGNSFENAKRNLAYNLFNILSQSNGLIDELAMMVF